LSTYYVSIKAAGGSFDHMAAYFPLVVGDAPSLWLNNLLAGNIKSLADLSQAFTSNFQATYDHPRNTFNLGRVTMKTNERCSTAPTRSTRRAPTASVNAHSSRECSTRPITRSDPEAMVIGRLHVATTTTTATIDVAEATMITVTINDVITSSRRTTVTSATYLLHRRQATPTTPSSRPRGRST
jgi:hypothetical protein